MRISRQGPIGVLVLKRAARSRLKQRLAEASSILLILHGCRSSSAEDILPSAPWRRQSSIPNVKDASPGFGLARCDYTSCWLSALLSVTTFCSSVREFSPYHPGARPPPTPWAGCTFGCCIIWSLIQGSARRDARGGRIVRPRPLRLFALAMFSRHRRASVRRRNRSASDWSQFVPGGPLGKPPSTHQAHGSRYRSRPVQITNPSNISPITPPARNASATRRACMSRLMTTLWGICLHHRAASFLSANNLVKCRGVLQFVNRKLLFT